MSIEKRGFRAWFEITRGTPFPGCEGEEWDVILPRLCDAVGEWCDAIALTGSPPEAEHPAKRALREMLEQQTDPEAHRRRLLEMAERELERRKQAADKPPEGNA